MIKYLVYGHIDKCMYISHKNMLIMLPKICQEDTSE